MMYRDEMIIYELRECMTLTSFDLTMNGAD